MSTHRQYRPTPMSTHRHRATQIKEGSYRVARSSWTQCVWRQGSYAWRWAQSPKSSWRWQSIGPLLARQKAQRVKWGPQTSHMSFSWTSILTNHDGGESLEGIERALSFAVFLFVLENQFPIYIWLHKHTVLYSSVCAEGLTLILSVLDKKKALYVGSPWSHILGWRRWFHTHTSSHPPWCGVSWWSSDTLSVTIRWSVNGSVNRLILLLMCWDVVLKDIESSPGKTIHRFKTEVWVP